MDVSRSSLALVGASRMVAVKPGGVGVAMDIDAGGVHRPLLYVTAGAASSSPARPSWSSTCRSTKISGSTIGKTGSVALLARVLEDVEGSMGGLRLIPSLGLVLGCRLRHAGEESGHILCARCLQI